MLISIKLAVLDRRNMKSEFTIFRNEAGNNTADSTNIKSTIREYYEQLYANKLDNLDKMDISLDRHKLQMYPQQETDNL